MNVEELSDQLGALAFDAQLTQQVINDVEKDLQVVTRHLVKILMTPATGASAEATELIRSHSRDCFDIETRFKIGQYWVCPACLGDGVSIIDHEDGQACDCNLCEGYGVVLPDHAPKKLRAAIMHAEAIQQGTNRVEEMRSELVTIKEHIRSLQGAATQAIRNIPTQPRS